MSDERKNDLERLERLKSLAKGGSLTDAEEACLQDIYAAHGPWQIIPATSIDFLDGLLGKRADRAQFQFLGLLERRRIDAILAAHEAPCPPAP